MRTYIQLLILNVSLFSFQHAALSQAPVLSYIPVISSGLNLPVDITNAGDGSNRLFIVEQDGLVKVYNGTALLPTPFLNLMDSTTASSEQGLLSIAFHPNYATNRYFFVYYTNNAGSISITRFQTSAGNPNVADPLSGVVLMVIPKPFGNHNGGDLNFGSDGYLYFGTGDGGSGGDPFNFSQNGNSLLGKMIRIDVNNFTIPPYYSIPPDNPYIADPNVLDEVWAIGVRNPWRWSFDRLNGDMWIGDVGQNTREEIDYRAAGTTGGINYGWRCYEGFLPYNTAGCAAQNTYISPIFDYPHNGTTGGFSVTGGFVYRGPDYPTLYGYYICADYVSGRTWLITPAGGGTWTTTLQPGLPGSVVSFGESETGVLYAITRPGTIHKVAVAGALPVRLLSFTGRHTNARNEITWVTANENDILHFRVTFSETGTAFQTAGSMRPLNNNRGNEYHFTHYTPMKTAFYRLETEDLNGTVHYSPVIKLESKNDNDPVSCFVNGKSLSVVTTQPVSFIALYSANGKKIFKQNAQNRQGYLNFQLPDMAMGIYTIAIHTADNRYNKKIMIGK
jgi:glucose/arabinose dehydrogenase